MSWFVPAAAGLYLFFCLLYARRTADRAESLQKGIFCLVLSLALPGAGPLLLWFCDHCARRAGPADYAEFYRGSEFCPDDLRRLQTPDLRAETDRVPMEEALLVSDLSYRRGMVMHLLDEADPLACLPALRRALANEDSETSHYASVAIMELRRKLQQQLDEAEARWRKVPRDADACAAWEELLYNVMQTDLFDRDVRRRLMQRHTALTNQMLRGSHPSEACLHHRIRMELQQGHCTRAQQLCTRYLKEYPRSEQAVRDQMEVCVQAKTAPGCKPSWPGCVTVRCCSPPPPWPGSGRSEKRDPSEQKLQQTDGAAGPVRGLCRRASHQQQRHDAARHESAARVGVGDADGRDRRTLAGHRIHRAPGAGALQPPASGFGGS